MTFLFIYSMSTNFRLELIEPSAREVEGQQFFITLTLFRVSLGSSHPLSSSPHLTRADGSISSRRQLVDTLLVNSITIETSASIGALEV